MSAKHTPGPWKAFNSINVIGVGNERSDVAWVRFEECGLMDTARSQEEDKANARLIAAAPDLLRALSDLIETITTPYASEVETRLAIKDAKIEISKATGEN